MSARSQPVAPLGARLTLDRLAKRFGNVVAVDEVSIEIRSGEFLTLLGPSGSGKTSTLMMVAGFEEPSAGAIWLDGQPLDGVPAYRRGFGMVFQNYALFPHMTVAENIAFPLKMRRLSSPARAAAVARALDLVRLAGYGERYPSQLSGGQQQRVALARALVYNPPVLLMDEPLGALDKKLREEMQLEIKRIQSELGITTIYVTHDQEEALVLSDRIAVMNNGRIEQVDQPDRLYEQPATPFVADFIGESNIIPLALLDGAARSLPEGNAAQATALVVRPEKVCLADETPGLDSVLSGTVSELIYVGDTTKYRIRVGEELLITVKRQNRAGQRRPAPGDSVRVGWRVEDSSLV